MPDHDFDISLEYMFPEPPRPPSPESTVITYHRDPTFVEKSEDWKDIKIRLVGDHPLWGHHLWNAARSFATYLDGHRELYQSLNVLELGAGGALPSLVATKNGARLVVITDYPDTDLIENIGRNVEVNLDPEEQNRVLVQGYTWGRPLDGLLETASSTTGRTGYDMIILSDLVFNHSQHDALLSTCEGAITQGETETGSTPAVLAFYTHHRPQLASRDMEFFTKAEGRGWRTEKIVEDRFPPMFPEDPGDESVRSTVHGWRLTTAVPL